MLTRFFSTPSTSMVQRIMSRPSSNLSPLRISHKHRNPAAKFHTTRICASKNAPTTEAAPDGRKQTSSDIRSSSKPLIDTSPPKGTRDFPPDEMRLRSWLFGHFRHVSRLYGFEEIDAPVLEAEELFTRKAGEEITEQLYNFEDKGGRRVALRPELTPSLARLVLQKGSSLPLPAKWFAIGQCWRYERMTRGRRREHYQWNMDIVGVPGIEAEAELLAAVVSFFRRVGLSSKDVGLKVSSRKVLAAVLARYNVPSEAFGPVCVIVDKMEKIPRDEVVKQLASKGVTVEAIEGILAALALRSLPALEALLGTEAAALSDLNRLFSLAKQYGYDDWLVFDASVVRGLAYYTGTVFEGFDRDGKLRAICGGGRYDRLLSTYGGVDQPAAGFGFGDAVIVELLKEKNLLPTTEVELNSVEDIVACLEEDLRPEACAIAARLRDKGRRVDLVLEDKKIKWVFKHSERVQAERLIILSRDAWKTGQVKIRTLSTREEQAVSVTDL